MNALTALVFIQFTLFLDTLITQFSIILVM